MLVPEHATAGLPPPKIVPVAQADHWGDQMPPMVSGREQDSWRSALTRLSENFDLFQTSQAVEVLMPGLKGFKGERELADPDDSQALPPWIKAILADPSNLNTQYEIGVYRDPKGQLTILEIKTHTDNLSLEHKQQRYKKIFLKFGSEDRKLERLEIHEGNIASNNDTVARILTVQSNGVYSDYLGLSKPEWENATRNLSAEYSGAVHEHDGSPRLGIKPYGEDLGYGLVHASVGNNSYNAKFNFNERFYTKLTPELIEQYRQLPPVSKNMSAGLEEPAKTAVTVLPPDMTAIYEMKQLAAKMAGVDLPVPPFIAIHYPIS